MRERKARGEKGEEAVCTSPDNNSDATQDETLTQPPSPRGPTGPLWATSRRPRQRGGPPRTRGLDKPDGYFARIPRSHPPSSAETARASLKLLGRFRNRTLVSPLSAADGPLLGDSEREAQEVLEKGASAINGGEDDGEALPLSFCRKSSRALGWELFTSFGRETAQLVVEGPCPTPSAVAVGDRWEGVRGARPVRSREAAT